MPTRDQFHPWYYTGASANKQLSIPTQQPGTYYILVYNNAVSAAGNQYTIEAQTAAFTLSSFAPGQIGTAQAATLLVTGTFPLAYQSPTAYQVQFVSAGGTVVPGAPLYLAPTGLGYNSTPGVFSDSSITMSAALPAVRGGRRLFRADYGHPRQREDAGRRPDRDGRRYRQLEGQPLRP